jgi:hypothetical protein
MKRIFKRGRYANVTATVALVVALGGTSYAAIKLPANSVSSKTVKDKSLLKKDFKSGQVPRGATGPGGAKGANGANGAPGAKGGPGDPGPAGQIGITPAGFSASTAGTVGFGSSVTVQSLSLPAGKYLIKAKAMAHNTNGSSDVKLMCTLNAGGADIDSLGGVGVDVAPSVAPVADTQVYLIGAATLGSAGTTNLVCTTDANTGTFLARNIIAVQLGN